MKSQEWNAAYGLAFLLVFVVFVVLGVFQTDRPLWQDESAIIENFGLPWGAYFTALPFNDQAAPPFALILQDLMWRLASGDVASMRLITLSLTATILGGIGLAAVRRRDACMLVALIILMTTPPILTYAIEIKHYTFELCAALLLLNIAITVDPIRRRGVILVFSLSVVMSLFSFSAMFISVVIFADLIVFRTQGRMRLLWLAALIGFVLTWVGLYISVFRPMTYFQLSNYPYESNTLLAQLQSGTSGVFKLLKQLLLPLYFGIALILSAVLLALRRRAIGGSQNISHPDFLLIRLAFGLIAALVLLSLVGQYPLFSERQLLFTHPPKALAVAALFIYIGGAGVGAQSFKPPLALLVIALAAHGALTSVMLTKSKHYIFQDTQALYDYVQTRPDIPVVPNILFAPTLRHYLRHDPQNKLTVLGALPFDTSEMDTTANVINNLNANAVGKLNNHIWLPLGEGDAYQAYTDYVARIAVDAGHITFAAAQFSSIQEAFLVESMAAAGCKVVRGFAAPSVRGFDVKCDP